MMPNVGEGSGKRALLSIAGGSVDCLCLSGEWLGLFVKIVNVRTLYDRSFSVTTYSAYTSVRDVCVVATCDHREPTPVSRRSSCDTVTQRNATQETSGTGSSGPENVFAVDWSVAKGRHHADSQAPSEKTSALIP